MNVNERPESKTLLDIISEVAQRGRGRLMRAQKAIE
jgi:hypothetical protein